MIGSLVTAVLASIAAAAPRSGHDLIPAPFRPIPVVEEQREPDHFAETAHRPPDDRDLTPAPSASVEALSSALIGTRPAESELPRTSSVLRGAATCHATGRDGLYAAAGSLLRKALGSDWRGTRILVCSSGRCIRVTLNDVCWCPKGRRLVDLSDEAFRWLAQLGLGVIPVEVRW